MQMQAAFLGFWAVLIGAKQYRNVDLSFGLVKRIESNINLDLTEEKLEILACFLFASFLWLSAVLLRRITLISLFSYMGWMYDPRGKISMRTKIWGLLLRLLVNRKAKIYDMQPYLPYLPLPSLNDTIRRYLRTVKPLVDEETYKRLEADATAFKKGAGFRFQCYLWLKWLLSSNYVSDWWEQFAYCKSRSPIICGSNIYGLEPVDTLWTTIPAARCANMLTGMLAFRDATLRNETTPVLVQSAIPLCNYQYTRQFNTTRIPGEAIDKIVHIKETSHVAVYSDGKWYKLDLTHQGHRLNPKELEIQLQKIIDDKSETSTCEKYLSSLTAGNRTRWAETRKRYFNEGFNKQSLNLIETNEEKKLDAYAKAMLHGKVYNRWFDKSLCFAIGKNGRIGMNVEHGWADAPVTSHMWECATYDEYFKLGYDENGHTKGHSRFANLSEPKRLEWKFNPEMEQIILTSYEEALAIAENTDLHIYVHNAFGKKEFKRCKTSPDAFIQMAMQLAYFNEFGRHDLTYESSMTRLFRYGRTETIRSCSIESCNWVKSMKDETVSKAERLRLFKIACEYHQIQCRDAMCGRAFDRHLFCLYIISNYLQQESPFLTQLLSQPWKLSTSQTAPTQGNKVDINKYPQFLPIGGGFGPVNDDGYGVSYVFCTDDVITFHICSKKSCDKTDSYRFGQQIKESMMSIKNLFD